MRYSVWVGLAVGLTLRTDISPQCLLGAGDTGYAFLGNLLGWLGVVVRPGNYGYSYPIGAICPLFDSQCENDSASIRQISQD